MWVGEVTGTILLSSPLAVAACLPLPSQQSHSWCSSLVPALGALAAVPGDGMGWCVGQHWCTHPPAGWMNPVQNQGFVWSVPKCFYKGRCGRLKYCRIFSLYFCISFLVLFHIITFQNMTLSMFLWLLNEFLVENEHNGWLTLILWMETLSVIYKQTQMWKRALHVFQIFPLPK